MHVPHGRSCPREHDLGLLFRHTPPPNPHRSFGPSLPYFLLPRPMPSLGPLHRPHQQTKWEPLCRSEEAEIGSRSEEAEVLRSRSACVLHLRPWNKRAPLASHSVPKTNCQKHSGLPVGFTFLDSPLQSSNIGANGSKTRVKSKKPDS